MKSVYVVEDDLLMSSTIDRIIQSLDPNVLLNWSTNAEEAISHLKQAKNHHRFYDLIIADIFLDGPKNGFDLWVFCKENHIRTPVLLISSTQKEKLAIELELLGKNFHFVEKPFKITEFRNQVKDLLHL